MRKGFTSSTPQRTPRQEEIKSKIILVTIIGFNLAVSVIVGLISILHATSAKYVWIGIIWCIAELIVIGYCVLNLMNIVDKIDELIYQEKNK